jgi:hypothetical protein
MREYQKHQFTTPIRILRKSYEKKKKRLSELFGFSDLGDLGLVSGSTGTAYHAG